MDPATSATSPRLRRQVLRQAVRENVYLKEGKRPPKDRPRVWPVILLLTLAVPAAALALVFGMEPSRLPAPLAALLPQAGGAGPGLGTSRPEPRGTRLAEGAPAGAPAVQTAAPSPTPLPRLAGQAEPIDSSVFPVGVRRIVLDPGHGGRDLGTVTAGGTPEKDLALDIANRLATLLRQRPGMEVLLTRDHDREVVLRDRARFANESEADLFVSIHLNWLQPASNRGVETFYLGTTQDPYLVQLASRENQESGYAMADVRKLLDGIYLELRQQESKELAAAVQRSLYQRLAQENPALRNRGVKSAPFLVLVGTQMPAILAEVACLSNQKEADLLATEAYRQTIAEALLAGIDSYTETLTRPVATGG